MKEEELQSMKVWWPKKLIEPATAVPAWRILSGLQLKHWLVSSSFVCQTPPGGLIAGWKVIVVITVATTINAPRVSSIQSPLYFKHSSQLRIFLLGCASFADSWLSTTVIDGGGRLSYVFPLSRRASNIKIFLIMRLLKSVGLCSKNLEAEKPIQFKAFAPSFTLDTESKYFTVCKNL